MIRNLILIQLSFIILFSSCYNKKNSENEEDKRLIINYVVDSIFAKHAPHSICGSFYYEMPESLLRQSYISIDTMITEDDFDYMVDQYVNPIKENIDTYLDTTRFVKINKLDDFQGYNFYNLHLTMTPPLFTKNGKECLIYMHSFSKEGQSGIFSLFEKEGNNWHVRYSFFSKAVESWYSDGYHGHDYSLVLPEELK